MSDLREELIFWGKSKNKNHSHWHEKRSGGIIFMILPHPKPAARNVSRYTREKYHRQERVSFQMRSLITARRRRANILRTFCESWSVLVNWYPPLFVHFPFQGGRGGTRTLNRTDGSSPFRRTVGPGINSTAYPLWSFSEFRIIRK